MEMLDVSDILRYCFQLQPGVFPHHLLGTVGNHGCLLSSDGQVAPIMKIMKMTIR